MGLVMTGTVGELRWGYHIAATLSSWRLSVQQAGSTLTATVVTADAFKTSQPSLTFRVVRPTTVWEWPIQSLRLVGGTLTARLGPQKA